MNTKTKERARNKGNSYFLRVPWNKGGLVNTGPWHPFAAWGYYNDQATGLPDFLDHPVKDSRERVSISSETRPVYVQSIYLPSILAWDWRHV